MRSSCDVDSIESVNLKFGEGGRNYTLTKRKALPVLPVKPFERRSEFNDNGVLQYLHEYWFFPSKY